MKFPKIPKWGWMLIVLVAVWYIFVREGVDATLKKKAPAPTVVDSAAKQA